MNRVTMSIDRRLEPYFKGKVNGDYEYILGKYKEFENRGHDMRVVFSDDVVDPKRGIFGGIHRLDDGKFKQVGRNCVPEGDIFFMQGYGQDTVRGTRDLSKPKDFLRAIQMLSKNHRLMVNPPEVNWYSLKNVQKKVLRPYLPYMPSVEPENRKDLERILRSGQRVVAKPQIGERGEGIVFLDSPEQVSGYFDSCERLGDYCFEGFVPASKEIRYFILDGRIHNRVRVNCMEGGYGSERVSEVYIDEPRDRNQVDVVERFLDSPPGRKIIYGSVDFRGPNVLEFNGSGAGSLYGIRGKEGSYTEVILNINPDIVDAVERRAQIGQKERRSYHIIGWDDWKRSPQHGNGLGGALHPIPLGSVLSERIPRRDHNFEEVTRI